MKTIKWILRLLFLVLFMGMAYYIVKIETERYESTGIALLKDLGKKQSIDLSSILTGQGSSTMQDSKILELYIRSHEMFNYIDHDYNLTGHYTSNDLDFVQRLYGETPLPFYKANQKNILEQYNENLKVLYDDPSGTLELTFVHTDPVIAQKILRSIIGRSESIINEFAKENAEIALHFIEKQKEKKRALFVQAIKKLIAYQNRHHTLDPQLDAERKNAILAELEADLVKKEVEYRSKLKSNWNPNGNEMKMLKATIIDTKASIATMKRELSGNNKKDAELNVNIFDFQLLKNEMEFAKEVYRQTLINQEELKIEVAQQSKHLIVVAQPTLADDYSYPNKLWDIFTIMLILFAVYSILIAIIAIIDNHKD